MKDLEEAKQLVSGYPYATRDQLTRDNVELERFLSNYRLNLSEQEKAEFRQWLERG